MAKITTDAQREIIDDFARVINERRKPSKPPRKGVINFRYELQTGTERDVWEVPVDLLRYRKHNGRIASDVLSYEKLHGVLKEDSDEAQKKLAEFLREKDPEPTKVLEDNIKRDGQTEPAIITADGFLINGNRRKLVLDELCQDPKNGDKFKYMRVIILPGKGDTGGPPTLKEIEQIENRYQLRKEGKAEYYKFDRALSIRMKIEKGMTLAEQLRDDPTYAGLPEKDFQREVRKYEEEYLKPLECIDRYLERLGREGLYDTISAGISDRDGRWQAFFDYSKSYQQFRDERKRQARGIPATEVGIIEDVSFKLIRKRDLTASSSGVSTDLPKLHKLMRDLPRLFGERDDGKPNFAKRELLRLKDVELDLPREEKLDKNGNEMAPQEVDKHWGKKHEREFIHRLKKAYHVLRHEKEFEAPINLLREALEKLNDEMLKDPSSIGTELYEEAESLARDIKNRAIELEKKFIEYQKDLKKLSHNRNE